MEPLYSIERPDKCENPALDEKLKVREYFFKYVFKNKLLWYLACANAFVYLVRYGVVDWAPTYLSEVKKLSQKDSAVAYFAYEYAGIPGTILCGYLSDKVFKGDRAITNIIYMTGVLAFVLIYWLNPPGSPTVDLIALTGIGFLIYGPVMLIGVQSIDLVPKNAAGTAAGLTGLFGYLGGAVAANILMGFVVDRFGWDGGFTLLLISSFVSMIFMGLTYKKNKSYKGI
ncbi:MAG: MFS transporter, partial [Oligoflexales bacterium]|nr:MFS transporter [Oligoflexales bacterium]